MLKILIVEDEVINQLFMTSILKKIYSVFSANNSSKALSIVQSEQIDLILMDISLKGGMNGLELTKEIRKNPAYSSTPIIAVTGHVNEEELQKTIDAGCNKFITKPFDAEKLLSLVGGFLNK